MSSLICDGKSIEYLTISSDSCGLSIIKSFDLIDAFGLCLLSACLWKLVLNSIDHLPKSCSRAWTARKDPCYVSCWVTEIFWHSIRLVVFLGSYRPAFTLAWRYLGNHAPGLIIYIIAVNQWELLLNAISIKSLYGIDTGLIGLITDGVPIRSFDTTLITRFMGQHVAHLGPTGPRWAPCWPHELCYLGIVTYISRLHQYMSSSTSAKLWTLPICLTS